MIELRNLDTLQWTKVIISTVIEDFLMNNKPYTVLPDGKIISEMQLLFAKQTNLLESFLILMENNHAEEAVIIFRSILNNAMIIQYLSTGDTEYRFKNYKAQPLKAAIKKLKNYKFVIDKDWFENTDVTTPMSIEEVEAKIESIKEELINRGLTNSNGEANLSLLNIRNLAESDLLLFSMYAQFYDMASKFEHSDPSCLEIYKEPIDEQTPTEIAYIINLNKTNIELYDEIMFMTISIYGITFVKLLEYIKNNIPDLIQKQSEPSLALLCEEFEFFIENKNIKKPV
ncbi:DUF5677 domain-containing protein [Bacillus cereus]|uniref:DUF5677 domain-containing protein n=1 Tax=Bacillus cereus TaxID=1396 RepID=UPI000BF32327|nr:DUF5677 domain-containing protein [Bacillus cereus]PET25189.1 hypothetical protein CN519_24055 [Bacillus cereus]PFI11463.1 hypothetical protein COI71_28965 [Bacillus cereus]